jgi:hypothetical protein
MRTLPGAALLPARTGPWASRAGSTARQRRSRDDGQLTAGGNVADTSVAGFAIGVGAVVCVAMGAFGTEANGATGGDEATLSTEALMNQAPASPALITANAPTTIQSRDGTDDLPTVSGMGAMGDDGPLGAAHTAPWPAPEGPLRRCCPSW